MKNMTLTKFTEETGAKSAVPGGGSVSAMCGSLAAALAQMVANLTIGNREYLQYEEEMMHIVKETSSLREELLDEIEKDGLAFTKVMDAYKMPKGSDIEKSNRTKAIQSTLKNAVIIPMEVAKKSLKVMEFSEVVVKKGNKNAVTDGMVSAMMARTAALGALLNAKINLNSIKDEDFKGEYKAMIEKLEKRAIEKEKVILEGVNL